MSGMDVNVSSSIQNPEKVITQIANHIGLSCSDDFIREVSEATKFHNLKKAAYEEETTVRKEFGEDFSFYRKGTKITI